MLRNVQSNSFKQETQHINETQALPLEECSGLRRNCAYATDKKIEQYEEDRYAKTFTCYSQTHRFKNEQNRGNENRCNSRYVLRKQKSTYD